MKKIIKYIGVPVTSFLILSQSFANELPSYHNASVANSAIQDHINNPTVESDPFIVAASGYTEKRSDLRGEFTNSALATNSDLYIKSVEIISSSRNESIKNGLHSMQDKINVALKTHDDELVKKAYEDYYTNYKQVRLNSQTAIKNNKLNLIVSAVQTQDETLGDVTQEYQQATVNFVNAYNDEIIRKRENIYGGDIGTRIAAINTSNSRVAGILSKANLFGSNCSACVMPEITPPPVVVVTPPEPAAPKPTPPRLPAYKCLGDNENVYGSLCDYIYEP